MLSSLDYPGLVPFMLEYLYFIKESDFPLLLLFMVVLSAGFILPLFDRKFYFYRTFAVFKDVLE